MKRWMILVGSGVAAAYVIYTLISIYFVLNGEGDRVGQFGDSFGFFNAFFAGGAFLSVVYTLNLQMTELREQRKQFEKMADIQSRALDIDIRFARLEYKLGFPVARVEEDVVVVAVTLIVSVTSKRATNVMVYLEGFPSQGWDVLEAGMEVEFEVNFPLEFKEFGEDGQLVDHPMQLVEIVYHSSVGETRVIRFVIARSGRSTAYWTMLEELPGEKRAVELRQISGY